MTTEPAFPTSFTGRVTKVHDGDSIHITPRGSNRIVIRLSGIDAPELTQRFGKESRDHLQALLINKTARATCHKKDRYQRYVCAVNLDKTNIGLNMIETGNAWHYTAYQQEQGITERWQFKRAEKNARKNRTGLWENPRPVAPWDYRNR